MMNEGSVEMHGPRPRQVSGRMRRRLVIGLLIALGLGDARRFLPSTVVAGDPKAHGLNEGKAGAIVKVKAIRPRRDPSFRLSSQQIATVEPYVQAGLKARVSGVVRQVSKNIGEPVRAGYDTAQFRLQEIQARVSAEVAEAARTSGARFGALGDAQEAVRQAQEMYRKFKDIQFGMIGPKAQFDALELLTAVQALNQARVSYLQQVVEFNRSQFRLYAAIGQSAGSGIDDAVTQPLGVPVVPLRPPIVPAISDTKP